jgi:hypothetical protein
VNHDIVETLPHDFKGKESDKEMKECRDCNKYQREHRTSKRQKEADDLVRPVWPIFPNLPQTIEARFKGHENSGGRQKNPHERTKLYASAGKTAFKIPDHKLLVAGVIQPHRVDEYIVCRIPLQNVLQDRKHYQAGWVKTDQRRACERQAECMSFSLKNQIAEKRHEIFDFSSDPNHQLAIDHVV